MPVYVRLKIGEEVSTEGFRKLEEGPLAYMLLL